MKKYSYSKVSVTIVLLMFIFQSGYSQIVFGIEQVLDQSGGFVHVHSGDLDGDGDEDIIECRYSSLLWFENNGFGEFGEQIIISTMNNRSVCSADLNGDNKYDIITASYYQEKVSWYENMGLVGINQNPLPDFSVFPNPATTYLIIKSNSIINKLQIINLLGQNSIYGSNTDRIDISNLNSGIYYIKITDINGNIGVKKVIKN